MWGRLESLVQMVFVLSLTCLLVTGASGRVAAEVAADGSSARPRTSSCTPVLRLLPDALLVPSGGKVKGNLPGAALIFLAPKGSPWWCGRKGSATVAARKATSKGGFSYAAGAFLADTRESRVRSAFGISRKSELPAVAVLDISTRRRFVLRRGEPGVDDLRIASLNTIMELFNRRLPLHIFDLTWYDQNKAASVYGMHMDPVDHLPVDLSHALRQRYRANRQQLWELAERSLEDDNTAGRGDSGFALDVGFSNSPPKSHTLSTGHRDSVFDFLRNDNFQKIYWEKWPLLIRAPGAFDSMLTIDQVLNDGPYLYGFDKYNFPHKNVNYLRVTFGNKDRSTSLHSPQGKKELVDALRRNYTLQLLGTHIWMPEVANMSYWVTKATHRPVSVNMYITPPMQSTSLVPHSDFQCSLMVQLAGRKRWRLWKQPSYWLPVRYRHIRGRDDGDEVLPEWLGDPYMDVVLEPGDILYVPRGCIHLTSTPPLQADQSAKTSDAAAWTLSSMHLTVGMEAMWDTGVSATWEAFFGAGQFFRHDHAVEAFYEALGNLIDKDLRFRQTVPQAVVAPAPADMNRQHWREEARARLHSIVDEMIDGTQFLNRTQRLMRATLQQHVRKLRATAAAAMRGGGNDGDVATPGGGRKRKRRTAANMELL